MVRCPLCRWSSSPRTASIFPRVRLERNARVASDSVTPSRFVRAVPSGRLNMSTPLSLRAPSVHRLGSFAGERRHRTELRATEPRRPPSNESHQRRLATVTKAGAESGFPRAHTVRNPASSRGTTGYQAASQDALAAVCRLLGEKGLHKLLHPARYAGRCPGQEIRENAERMDHGGPHDEGTFVSCSSRPRWCCAGGQLQCSSNFCVNAPGIAVEEPIVSFASEGGIPC